MAALGWPQSLLGDRRTEWAVGFLALTLLALGNLPWQLDDYDQAKQAFTSFQMVNQGRWFYQTTPHDWIATKPPLVGWISAALFSVTRSWEFAWRAPSFLAAAVIGILVFRLAKSAYGATPGAIALAAFTLNLLTPRLATLVRTDMPLALVVFLIGAMIWNKLRQQQSWRPNDNALMFLLLTAGMLIKGPVVWAFLLPGMAICVALRRGINLYDFGAWWPWIASLAVFLAWAAAGIRFVPGFYDQVVVHEFFGRFGGEAHRAQPVFFYLPHLLHKFAPWSLLMLGLGILELRAAEWHRKKWNVSPETLWLICWSFGGLAVMSVLPSKRVDRIFPVIPPLCLLLGAQLKSAVSRIPPRKSVYGWTAAALAFALLFSGGYVVSRVRAGYRQHVDALVRFGQQARQQAAVRHLRYAVVSAPAESLLLYLRQTHFLLPARAATQWNAGELDGLVVSVGDLPELNSQLTPAGVTVLQSDKVRGDPNAQYVLITKGQ